MLVSDSMIYEPILILHLPKFSSFITSLTIFLYRCNSIAFFEPMKGLDIY